jgi:hypothetical protein
MVALGSAVQLFCYLSFEETSLQVVGSSGLISGWLQGAQFCGGVSGETKPAGLCLLLPVEQQKLRILPAQGRCFPGV